MKKYIKYYSMIMLVAALCCGFVACSFGGESGCKVAEEVKLETVVLNEVEFKNGDTVSFEQECDEIKIGGTIDAMTTAQKSVFGVDDVTHMIAVNVTFDKERTLSYFEIQGKNTKVYSTNETDENFVGSLTELLDNESGEDAYCGLILSANTKNYRLTTRYTDGYESVIEIKISATLATAEIE